MPMTYSDLQQATEGFFVGTKAERKRAVAILNAIKERLVTREVPTENVWYQRPNTEDQEEDDKERKRPADTALDAFPTENENKWSVDLVVHVEGPDPVSYSRFYNQVSIKFDSPGGTARLFLADEEIARTELNSSPVNQAELARFCDALFERMMSSHDPESGQRRKIGFSNS
jgi:hypothetical protein